MAAVHGMLMAASPGFVFDDVVSTDLSNYNLRTRAVAAGWDGVQPLVAGLTRSPGVVISSTTTAAYAFDTGTTPFPAGSSLRISDSASFIIGRGGDANGGAGGNAFRTIASMPVTFDNLSGTVGAGGGAGGVGQSGTSRWTSTDGKSVVTSTVSGGTGGGGRTGRTASSPNGTFASAGAGSAGSATSIAVLGGAGNTNGGTGGAGGTWGSAGSSGGAISIGGATSAFLNYTGLSGPGAGGAAGVCIVGNAYITWVNTGTRLGAIT